MTDKELLELFHNENTKEKAFGLLMDKYQEKLYWHIRRMTNNHDDANDLLQNTFMKIWSSLQNFRADAQLYTWMYRIATNETINFLNYQKKRPTISFDNHDGSDEEGYSPSNFVGTTDTDIDGDEVQRKLKKAIDLLPEKQKIVFNMRYYEEMSYEQMSEVLNTSVGALKASYHHAVQKIEKFITKTD